MIPYLWVAAGSAMGGVGRYALGLAAGRLWGEAFPWGTILINIIGSFVISFFATLTTPNAALPASANIRIFVMVGICGGFTTFSSFSLQTLALAREGNWIGTLSNVLLSVALCLAAVTLGQVAADRLNAAPIAAMTGSHHVVALLDQPETAPLVLASSSQAAQRFGSRQILALHIRPDMQDVFMPTEEVMTETRRQELEGEATERATALQAAFEAWRSDSAVPARWKQVTGDAAGIIQREAEGSDLVVAARPQAGHNNGILHATLFHAGRPTLLVTDAQSPAFGEHVAIGWKPSESLDRAIAAAWPLLSRAARVTILLGSEHGQPSDQPTQVLRALENGQVPVEIDRFDIDGHSVGEALLREARRVGADLLVVGAYGHGRLVEMVLGGATQDLIQAADLPVLLQH